MYFPKDSIAKYKKMKFTVFLIRMSSELISLMMRKPEKFYSLIGLRVMYSRIFGRQRNVIRVEFKSMTTVAASQQSYRNLL